MVKPDACSCRVASSHVDRTADFSAETSYTRSSGSHCSDGSLNLGSFAPSESDFDQILAQKQNARSRGSRAPEIGGQRGLLVVLALELALDLGVHVAALDLPRDAVGLGGASGVGGSLCRALRPSRPLTERE